MAFAREGSDVVVADIQSPSAEAVSKEVRALGRKSLPLGVDVASRSQVEEMIGAVMGAFGRIDILANVAGIFIKSPIEEVSEEDWERVMAVNLKGTFLCSQAVGRQMIKQGKGSIINIASLAAHIPQMYAGAYSPSKAGVLLLSKLMAAEWAKYHIRVNCLSPGAIATDMTEYIFNTEALRNARTKAIPMNRFGTPEEVANAAVFLASSESSYITGHSIVIDGGSLDSMHHLLRLLAQ